MVPINVENKAGLSPRAYAITITNFLTKKHPSRKYTTRSLDWSQSPIPFVGESFNVGIFRNFYFFSKQIGTVKYTERPETNNITIELKDKTIKTNELEEIINKLQQKREIKI